MAWLMVILSSESTWFLNSCAFFPRIRHHGHSGLLRLFFDLCCLLMRFFQDVISLIPGFLNPFVVNSFSELLNL